MKTSYYISNYHNIIIALKQDNLVLDIRDFHKNQQSIMLHIKMDSITNQLDYMVVQEIL